MKFQLNLKSINLQINSIDSQCYLLPYIKFTYSRWLNGNYEIIVGWLTKELCIVF